jgi:hypothetical protein
MSGTVSKILAKLDFPSFNNKFLYWVHFLVKASVENGSVGFTDKSWFKSSSTSFVEVDFLIEIESENDKLLVFFKDSVGFFMAVVSITFLRFELGSSTFRGLETCGCDWGFSVFLVLKGRLIKAFFFGCLY